MPKLIAFLVVMLVTIQAIAQGVEQSAMTLFDSLSPEQKKQAVLPFDSPERNQQMFTPGKRAGIQIENLRPEQQQMAIGLITRFTSEYGAAKCKEIADQNPKPGFGQYYLVFFGNPSLDKEYAWRIAEHHLTLVNVEVKDGKANVFGPVLLGANPSTLWNDEEDAMILLYAALTPDEREKLVHKGKSESTAKFTAASLKVSELNLDAQKRVQEVYDGRLKFFAPDIQQRIRDLVQEKGGLAAMEVAFWGKAERRCSAGGRWDFKLGGDSFLCDYENTRGHIHMSLEANLDGKSGT